MALVKIGPLHLRTKDKAFILVTSTLLILLAPLAWLFHWYGTVVLVFGFMVSLLMIIQIEVYRRMQNHLRAMIEKHGDVTDVLQSRRSVRDFIDEPVKKLDLEKMLETARMAPSGSNLQPWHFIVIQRQETIDKMERTIRKTIGELEQTLEGYGELPRDQISAGMESWRRASLVFPKAPVTLAVLVKELPNLYPQPYVRYLMERKGLSAFEARKHMGSVELLSVAAAIENLLLAAYSLGYGACWLRVPFMAKDELESLLGVRPPWELIALVPVGVPAPEALPPRRERKTIEEITTFV